MEFLLPPIFPHLDENGVHGQKTKAVCIAEIGLVDVLDRAGLVGRGHYSLIQGNGRRVCALDAYVRTYRPLMLKGEGWEWRWSWWSGEGVESSGWRQMRSHLIGHGELMVVVALVWL